MKNNNDIGVSRRRMLGGLALGAAGVATGSLLVSPSSASATPKWDLEADVVCIGYGGAAAITSITAADLGASVIIIEKQPQDTEKEVLHTPNTRSSGGAIVCPTDAQKASDHLFALSWGLTPRDLCDAWGEYGTTNVQWIEKLGGTMVPESEFVGKGEFDQLPGHDAIKFRQYRGAGPAFFQFLDRNISERRARIRVLYETPGRELITDEHGSVIGVQAERAGRKIAIEARKAVVLTCGGYEWDEQLKANSLRGYPTYFYGNPGNTGDGIRMAAKVGAAMWHMNTMAGRLVPYKSGHKPAFRGGTPNGFILVNKYGRRYFRERPWAEHSAWLEACKFDTAQSEYSSIPCYSIFDDVALKQGPPAVGAVKGTLGDGTRQTYYKWSRDYVEEIESGFLMKGGTIEELANVIAADNENSRRMIPEQLKATIETYNAYCNAGKDSEFGRDPKTLIPIKRGPFYAMKMYPGGPNTQGGSKKNAKGQVLDAFDQPIPHLYCVGELGSIYGFLYPSAGGNLCEMIVFGRIAGAHMMKDEHEVTPKAHPVTAAIVAVGAGPKSAGGRVTLSLSKDECLKCHGPFDDLAKAKSSHVPSGPETVNPHRHIPHDATDAKSVPSCTSCHTSHSGVSGAGISRSKADLQFCYDSCHHQNNFQPCSECHNEKK